MNTAFCILAQWKLSYITLNLQYTKYQINSCYYRWLQSLEWTYTWTFLNLKAEADMDLCGRQNFKMAPQIPTPWCACPV